MTTPGAIKRYISNAWALEGSFVLFVPDAASMPTAPDDNGVFCFVQTEQRLYYSNAGAWVRYATSPRVAANYAALPTGDYAGEVRATSDTGTLWVWTGTYWRPQIAAASGSVNFSGGTIATSGSLALGTISFSAVPYPRLITCSAQLLITGATASCAFQLNGTHVSGGTWVGRMLGPGAPGGTIYLDALTNTLAANTAGTISFTAGQGGGTPATATAVADGRFSRADWFSTPA